MAKNFGIVLLLAACQTIIGLVVGKLPECQDVCIVFLNLYYVFQLTWKIYIYIYIYILVYIYVLHIYILYTYIYI